MQIMKGEKWILLGASSGLGKAFAQWSESQTEAPDLFLMSRKSPLSADFSKEEEWEKIATQLQGLEPDRIFYFAGGGPWGPFNSKKWSSHLWTYRVNLLFPAFLISKFPWVGLKQATFVGSAIAENHPDADAASYSSAKHGLKGLITSIQAEKSLPQMDLRLFSPGYLDTPLLPSNAWPRQIPGKVASTAETAVQLGDWIQQVHSANSHLSLG